MAQLIPSTSISSLPHHGNLSGILSPTRVSPTLTRPIFNFLALKLKYLNAKEEKRTVIQTALNWTTSSRNELRCPSSLRQTNNDCQDFFLSWPLTMLSWVQRVTYCSLIAPLKNKFVSRPQIINVFIAPTVSKSVKMTMRQTTHARQLMYVTFWSR